jgi:predicted RND superfamily exporter protein
MKALAAVLARFAGFGIRRRKVVLAGTVAFVVAAPFFLRGLRLDSDAARIIPYEDRLGTAYRQSRELFGDANRLVIELRHSDVPLSLLNRFTHRVADVLRSWEDIEYVDIKPLDLADREETAARLRAALLNTDSGVFEDFASRFTEKGMRRALLRTRKRLIALDDPEMRDEVANDLLDVRDVLL